MKNMGRHQEHIINPNKGGWYGNQNWMLTIIAIKFLCESTGWKIPLVTFLIDGEMFTQSWRFWVIIRNLLYSAYVWRDEGLNSKYDFEV